MIRRSLALAALAATLSFNALAKIHIVEIAVFDCQYCKETEHYTDLIELNLKGDDAFVFAPISTDLKTVAWPYAYYLLRDFVDQDKLRDTIFTLRQDFKLDAQNPEEALDLISINMTFNPKQIEILKNIKNDSERHGKAALAYERAVKLAIDNKVRSTPTFIIVDDNGKTLSVTKPSAMQVKEYVDLVIERYKGFYNE